MSERRTMLLAARIVTLAGFLIIAAISLFAGIDRPRAGELSVMLKPVVPSSNTRFNVTAAADESPLRLGDQVLIDDRGTLAAITLRSLPAGSTLDILRTLPPPEKLVAVPVNRSSRSPLVAVLTVTIETTFVAIAALIALRGRSPGSLPLAWFFALLTVLVNPTTPAWPYGLLVAYQCVNSTLAVAAFMCATEFATRLCGTDPNGWAYRLRRVSRWLGVFAMLINAGVSLDEVRAPQTPLAAQNAAIGLLFAQVACFLTALGFAFGKAATGERERVRWVTASLAVGIVGFVLAVIGSAVDFAEPLRDYPLLLLLAMPLGCAYAILRYRLLDIGFVINRATVFGVTSLLVLGALALVDSGLQALLGSWLIRTGLWVQLALALAIGIATRPVHERIDRAVDDVFFRRRHEAERALRQFARDVAHIDDPDVVVERTVVTVARAADLRCAIFIAAKDGSLAEASSTSGVVIDRNDEAAVRLRATREAVDLREVRTVVSGDFAFPMFARNRLLGILVCAGKTDGVAAYAPDELEAIGAVAHAAGLAIDLLHIDELEREVERSRMREFPGLARGV